MRATIKELELEQNIIWTGLVPYEQLPGYYHYAKAIIFASTCENCPNILLEAMGSGRPLFVSDRPPMPDFAEDAAIYFNPEVPEDLAQKLVKYLDDQPYLQSLGAKAAQLAENYSWEETSRRTFEAILRVAKR